MFGYILTYAKKIVLVPNILIGCSVGAVIAGSNAVDEAVGKELIWYILVYIYIYIFKFKATKVRNMCRLNEN